MTNLLRVAANVLQDKMEQFASVDTEVAGTGAPPQTLPAIVGRSITIVDSSTGLAVRITTRDFIYRQSTWLIAMGRPPKRNDVIRYTEVGCDTEEYRVNGDGHSSHYEETDGHNVAWRVHTKQDKLYG